MARQKKIGLSYFPLDCQMDDKVEMLEAEHGLAGFAVYLKLLQSIYQTEAGELDMAVVFRWKTLAKQYGVQVESLQAMVETMFTVCLFDRQAFETRQVLTSTGIQKRISAVAELRDKDRKRKKPEPADFPDGISHFPGGKPTENVGKSTQKEKERESTTDVVPDKPAAVLRRLPLPAEDVQLFDPATWPGLSDPARFAAICTQLGYPQVNTERYRQQILVSLEDKQLPAVSLRNWIKSYLNNDEAKGKLMLLPVLTPNEVPGNWDTVKQGAYKAPMGQGIPNINSLLKPEFQIK